MKISCFLKVCVNVGDIARLGEVQAQDDQSVFDEDGEKTKDGHGCWLRCFVLLVWRALQGAFCFIKEIK